MSATHYHVPLRKDRTYFAHTPTERRVRELTRERRAGRVPDLVAIPGRTRRPATLRQIGWAFLRLVACTVSFLVVFIAIVGWTVLLTGAGQ